MKDLHIIKATDKDKEQTQKLLHGIKDLLVFEDQIQTANELFKKAVIMV